IKKEEILCRSTSHARHPRVAPAAQLTPAPSLSDIHESPILEDDDDFDPVPKSTTTTIATSEQSTESCDTSPDIISPTMSQEFEDLSQGHYDFPAVNGQSLTDEDTADGLD
ncbi:kxDL motif-containing protein 1, partial [Oxyura jamaicensis]|uniref:kxDL motif-containing protein 1 n=1 Tax=Oxyura jamaicensis TaxID=8884 RepID=UPI0015A5092A